MKKIIGIKNLESIKDDLINKKIKPQLIVVKSSKGMGKTVFIDYLIKKCKFFPCCIKRKENVKEQTTEIIKKIKRLKSNKKTLLIFDDIDEYKYFDKKELGGSEPLINLLGSIVNASIDSLIIVFTLNDINTIDEDIYSKQQAKIMIDLDDITDKDKAVSYYMSLFRVYDQNYIDEIKKGINSLSVKEIKELIKAYKTSNKTIKEIVDCIVKNKNKDTSIVDFEVSYHETGHAICAYLLKQKPKFISIVAKKQYRGVVLIEEEENRLLQTEDLINNIKISLASSAAEELFLNKKLLGSLQDYESAYQTAYNLITKYNYLGLEYLSSSNIPLSESKQQIIEKETSKILNSLYAEVLNMLKDNKEKVEIVRNELLEKKTLTYEDLNILMEK